VTIPGRCLAPCHDRWPGYFYNDDRIQRRRRGMAGDLIRFYLGIGADARGRLIEQIWAFDDAQLEEVHDYIQWLFPLDEPSAFNPDAPVLSPADRAEFQARPELRQRLRRSRKRMLAFYGLSLSETADGAVRITKSADFEAKREQWLSPGDHNHLRLTRIMKCLALCGMQAYAQALGACLLALVEDDPRNVSPETHAIWRSLVRFR
jgi:hypothetical protein